MTKRTLSLALFATLELGCATSGDDPPATAARNADDGTPASPDLQSHALHLEGDLDPETIQALAQHLEAMAEVHSVEISIERTNDGPTTARLALTGRDMPSEQELRSAVLDFDGLGDDVSVEVDDGTIAPPGVVDATAIEIAADDTKTPEQIKAEVAARLRAQGLEGHIQIDVSEVDGERRVEVSVEQQSDEPPKH